jgi:integrase
MRSVPPLKFHKPSGLHRAYLTDLKGRRGYRYFSADAPTAEAEYEIAVEQFARTAGKPRPLVADVIEEALRWAKTEYPPTGRFGGEAEVMKYALRFLDRRVTIKLPSSGLVEVYLPKLAADDFSLIHLASVQRAMIAASKARTYINGVTDRIIRAFTAGRVAGLVSKETLADLMALKHVRSGHPTVKETGRVLSVDDATVRATLPALSAKMVAIIGTIRESGSRPGEIVKMRLDMLTTPKRGDWLYDLGTAHKTSKRRFRKVIRLNERAKSILRPWVQAARARMDLRGFIFPSNLNPDGHIQVHSLRKRVAEACDELGIKPAWSPSQLRHLVATETARAEAEAIRAAQRKLQHSSTATTRGYVDPGATA